MSVPLSEGECTQERMSFSMVADAVRLQWDEMEGEERAFLIYCLQRLRHHLEASASEPRLPPSEQV